MNNNINDSILFSKALAYASIKHSKQLRKNNEPYIWHPVRVAKIVKDAKYDIKYQIVALLHDALEDSDAKEEEIALFGDDVLEAVKLLTRKTDDEEEYVNSILTNKMASVVKSGDIINNMFEAGILARNNLYLDWSNIYFEKAEKYYKGKFCPAVDNAITLGKSLINNNKSFDEALLEITI